MPTCTHPTLDSISECGEAMRYLMPLLLVMFFSPTSVFAQGGAAQPAAPLQQNQAWQSSGGYNRYQQQVMTILLSPTYQKELELSDEQKQKVTEFRKQLTEGYKEIYDRYPELKDRGLDYRKRAEIHRKFQAEYEKLREDIDKDLLDQLIPNQKTVLTRLQFDRAVKVYGFSATLIRTEFAKQLETTEDQQAKLLKIKQETEAEIQKMIEAKRKEAKEKMLKVLDAKQRKKIKELESDVKPSTYTRL